MIAPIKRTKSDKQKEKNRIAEKKRKEQIPENRRNERNTNPILEALMADAKVYKACQDLVNLRWQIAEKANKKETLRQIRSAVIKSSSKN